MRSIFSLLLLLFVFSCGQETTDNDGEVNDTEESAEAEDPKVIGEEVTYQTDTTTMNGYLAYSDAFDGPRPGVLVIHEWWGHNDYARRRADMLAELGYIALAVDMYGDGKLAEHPEDAMSFMMTVVDNTEAARARFEAALDFLHAHELSADNKTAAIGYCFGGSVALTMANAGYDLDAVAAFHAGLGLSIWPESAEDVKANILVCNGADDPMISAEQVADFSRRYDELGIPYEYIAYDGAVHAFTDPGADAKGEEFGLPLAYNAEADQESWQELQQLLAESFQ